MAPSAADAAGGVLFFRVEGEFSVECVVWSWKMVRNVKSKMQGRKGNL